MRAYSRLFLLLAVAAPWACGKGNNDTLNNQNSVANTKPQGYVAGLVANAIDDTPLMGANVVLAGGGLSNQATTDDKGGFSFGPIAAGAMFSLHISAQNMTDALIAGVQIGDAAGNFPTDNGALYVGPIGLIPTTGKFTVQVVSQSGLPVPKATVTIETVVRYLAAGMPKGTVAASTITDSDGLAVVTGLPDVRALPPHLADSSALVVSVLPVDLPADGNAKLRGATQMISGADVRTGATIPVIVLPYAGDSPLMVIASNIPRLAMPMLTNPAVLDPTEPVRIVYSEPIDKASVMIDLRDETGAMVIAAPFTMSTLGNILFISPTGGLMAGMKYNLFVRAGSASSSHSEMVAAASPFFAKADASTPIAITGRFHDVNGDLQWGNGDGDQIELIASVPIGRAGQATPFAAALWVDLDLNQNGILGDSPGELPGTNLPYPPPLMIQGIEPASQNGTPASGFTRYITPVRITLALNPRGPAAGPVAFELRVLTSDNGGIFVTDGSGRSVPQKTTGSLPLQ